LLAGDHVYLSDFGIGRAMEAATRLTDSRDWLGTVDFCSPEQLRCARVDSRSDVYALGCLLHTALTGIPPHHRETAAATMLAHLNEPPPPASATTGVPDRLDAVLARALAKRPADRYATAGELAQAARAALEAGARSAETRRTARRPLATVGSQARKSLETVASRTRRLPRATRIRAPARTKLDLRPRPDSGAPRPGTRPAPRRLLALAAAVTLLVAAAVAAAALALSARTRPPGPLTGADIASAVHAFAGAYGHRDSNALASLLAADVTRVTPGATERGRAAVAAVYRRQLTDGSIVGYQVATLEVVPGWVGRASARYSILRIGRPTVSGRVTFGIERVRGRIRIGLIAAQPADH
jgi:serine/threonine-protein kinase